MKEWSNLARIVFRRTYSRTDNGYPETWDQTVERTIMGNVSGKNVPESEIKELLRLAKERKAGPAGRGYWFSGSPSHSKVGGAALNNCFSGSEKFITKEYGPVSFQEVVGKEVSVKTKNGWESSVVRSFGKQKVQDITFAPADKNGKIYRSNLRKTVRCTPDHGWFLLGGSKTNDLEVGDVVLSEKVNSFRFDLGDAYRNGFRHGLIFGDGTIANQKLDGEYHYQIRLCDERTKKYVSILKDVTYPESYGGDPVRRWYSYKNYKELPIDDDVEYRSGFLAGWMAADGNYSKNTPRLSSQHPKAKEWLEENAASCGYILTGFSLNNDVTNYGERKNPLLTFTLSESEVTWKVKHIESLPEEEDVFCVTVPSGAFTLASGIYTSNCWFLTAAEWESFIIAQDLLMLGGGVGLSVEHRFTSKLPKVKKDIKIVHKNSRDADFIVPDSREGWCELSYRCLESFFVTGKSFSYSTVCLRGSGEPIVGFGGVSSGPLPLFELVKIFSEILGA